MKKVVGIIGSPRKNGNTEILVDTILKGASESGYSTDKIHLYDFEIKPCTACDSCSRNNGICIIKDDLTKIIQKTADADVFILGTPVYWWGPTAQFKSYMDRWYSEETRNTIKGKKVILAIPMQDTEMATSSHTSGMLRDALEYIGTEIIDVIISPDNYLKGDINKHPDIISRAFSAGKNL